MNDTTKNLLMRNLRALLDVSELELAEASARLERARAIYRHLSEGLPAECCPMPSSGFEKAETQKRLTAKVDALIILSYDEERSE